MNNETQCKQLIVISGPSAAGKSTTANLIANLTGGKVYSIRDHYINNLVPEFLQKHDRTDTPTRKLHMEVADWLYATDPAAHAKRFLKDYDLSPISIIESFRIKGDLMYIHSKFPKAKFIHLITTLDERLKRKIQASDSLYTPDEEAIRQSLQYEWNHFKLRESEEYLRSIGALMLDTTHSRVGSNDITEMIEAYLDVEQLEAKK